MTCLGTLVNLGTLRYPCPEASCAKVEDGELTGGGGDCVGVAWHN